MTSSGFFKSRFCAALFVLVSTCGSEIITHPFVGITLIERNQTVPRQCRFFITLIELHSPGLRFKLTPQGGTRETIRQTTASFLAEEHAQLAINAHFYLPFGTSEISANLVGLAVSEGTTISPFEPQPISNEFPDQSYAIVPFSPAINIDRQNRATIVHNDPQFLDGRHIREATALWTAFSGSAQVVSNGLVCIPSYSAGESSLKPIYGYSDTNLWYLD